MSFRTSGNWIHSRIRLVALFSFLLLSLWLVIGALAEKRAEARSTTSQGPRQSSPIALTADDRTLINVNPEANTITVFDVSTDTPAKLAEIAVGVDPQSVAIHPDGTKAYVANAYEGTVSVVLLASNCVSSDIKVGTEPMAVVLSPNGTRLYVANSASNTLSVVNTTLPTPSVVDTVDLSSFGKAPRAIAVTNDGDTDDTDETIFVAFFFAELQTAAGFDDGRGHESHTVKQRRP